jgi:hypothetical protein
MNLATTASSDIFSNSLLIIHLSLRHTIWASEIAFK